MSECNLCGRDDGYVIEGRCCSDCRENVGQRNELTAEISTFLRKEAAKLLRRRTERIRNKRWAECLTCYADKIDTAFHDDFLDETEAEWTRKDPCFPALVAAAEKRRKA